MARRSSLRGIATEVAPAITGSDELTLAIQLDEVVSRLQELAVDPEVLEGPAGV
jgi:hypothetical protein